MNIKGPDKVKQQILNADHLQVFLDYDGTLADFSPTPDDIHPDPKLIKLIRALKNHPSIQVAIISGRRLSDIKKLIPVTGILLAGSYGIEMIDPEGRKVERVDYQIIRPYLEKIKPQWQELIHPYSKFFLEDKGWSLALHAKFIDPEIAEKVLSRAQQLIDQNLIPTKIFRVLGGHKFLEIAPISAHKGKTLKYLLSESPLNGSLLIYIGDDDKDEEAFEVVLQNNGIAIKVCQEPCNTMAQLRIESPSEVHQFLAGLL